MNHEITRRLSVLAKMTNGQFRATDLVCRFLGFSFNSDFISRYFVQITNISTPSDSFFS
jgi:hypothetical protein